MFVLNSSVFDFIRAHQSIWEKVPLNLLASKKELMAFEHKGFWQPMNTLRDKVYLEDLCSSNNAPWKVWDD